MNLAPSDLDAAPKGGSVQIGGRVVAVVGPTVTLADAFARVAVDGLAGAEALRPGDLVVVRGRAGGGGIRHATLVWRGGREGPDGATGEVDDDGDVARLLDGGGQALLARSVLVAAVREFFGRRRFLEVDTPARVPCPGLDVHLAAFATAEPEPRWLSTSPEYQMKRLLVGGLPRIFQIARCFRRGERGRWHTPEFAMVEWYRAFAALDEVVRDTEDLVRFVAGELLGAPQVTVDERVVDLGRPFERLAVAEAFARWAGIAPDDALALAERDETRFFETLAFTVEPKLAELPHGVFLVDWPIRFASLARPKPDDPRVCERFELYVGGVELCNGFGELTDPVEQRRRFERDRDERRTRGLDVYPVDDRFLRALEEGLPPSAGNALGLDRLLAVCLGAPTIADVQAIPPDRL